MLLGTILIWRLPCVEKYWIQGIRRNKSADFFRLKRGVICADVMWWRRLRAWSTTTVDDGRPHDNRRLRWCWLPTEMPKSPATDGRTRCCRSCFCQATVRRAVPCTIPLPLPLQCLVLHGGTASKENIDLKFHGQNVFPGPRKIDTHSF